MRVPFQWLCELTGIDASVDDVATRLTNAGFEVGAIHRAGEHWDRIVVGEVARIDPHPNADRLNLPTVNTGSEEIQVVCGAWNFEVGDRIAFAPAGARLWDPYADEPVLKELKPTRIRGVVSRGMLCSTKELGISDDHEGILVLDPDAPLGRPLAEALGGEVLEFELKANRPDALSVLGIAREAAALYGTEVRSPIPKDRPSGNGSQPTVRLAIDDPALCARYSAALVHDVTVGESPAWMRDRLEQAGVRPISTIVDATNYVMLELGQPLHAFDWDTVRGGFIGVRTARPGERLVTLDGQDRELTPDTLCIVDAEGPVALAGVMGGLDTEVTDKTATVLLESATFDPISIRRTAHRLNLRSEASRRFEKGLPPELTLLALKRCVQVIEEIGAGRGEFLTADAYPEPSDPAPVGLAFNRIERLMGVAYDRSEVRQALSALEFGLEENGDELCVTPPFWRRDVTAPADVIEEVARLVGYERIPDTLPTGQVMDLAPGEIDERDDEARDVMAGLGFAECVTYALTSEARMARLLPPDLLDASPDAPLGDSEAWAAVRETAMNDAGRTLSDRLLPLDREPLRLRNPLSMEENALRLTGLGTMLETLRANRRHADRDLLLFDYQPSFLARDGDLPEEPNFLTAVIGERVSADRWNETANVELPFVRGVVDELLSRSGVPTDEASHDGLQHPTFAAGAAAAVTVEGRLLAAYGEVDAEVASAFDLDERAWALLVDMPAVRAASGGPPSFSAWSEYPSALRDLAIVVDADVTQAEVQDTIQRAGRPLLQSARLFDEYRGEQIPAGKRSLAYALSYAAPDRTLTDKQADRAHNRVVRALQHRLGAELRG
ncbi:MAG: phenylalanine--tRNA ligase subunit beta [Chloroflexota bacterium]|nr:phenylalanine--tRNA ligase subunit beta [Chloroflexota bacterium]MDE2918654.1 phenylalanine--tRNA ligase subunit beta [Chloroflexota bacterium]